MDPQDLDMIFGFKSLLQDFYPDDHRDHFFRIQAEMDLFSERTHASKPRAAAERPNRDGAERVKWKGHLRLEEVEDSVSHFIQLRTAKPPSPDFDIVEVSIQCEHHRKLLQSAQNIREELERDLAGRNLLPSSYFPIREESRLVTTIKELNSLVVMGADEMEIKCQSRELWNLIALNKTLKMVEVSPCKASEFLGFAFQSIEKDLVPEPIQLLTKLLELYSEETRADVHPDHPLQELVSRLSEKGKHELLMISRDEVIAKLIPRLFPNARGLTVLQLEKGGFQPKKVDAIIDLTKGALPLSAVKKFCCETRSSLVIFALQQ